jgi:hypothetical protein
MDVGILVGVMSCLTVVAIYFWLVRKQTQPEQA